MLLGLCLFVLGFGIGWQNKNSKWNQELELAADEIAAAKSGVYVPEFGGVVYLALPREPSEPERHLMERIREKFDSK